MTRALTKADLIGKSNWDLDVMRNEIYARYGRRFKRTDLQKYFDQQKWYFPKYYPEDFPIQLLTDLQVYNARFIQKYQQNR